jgi:uncharacterized repeat protein (TIGR03847 family)
MTDQTIDLNPTERFTIDAIGESQDGLFVLQGQSQGTVVTLLIELDQLQALSLACNELLDMLDEMYSREINQFQIPSMEDMELHIPVEPLFEVAHFQLGYDEDSDTIVIISVELAAVEDLAENASTVRFWITREQTIGLIRKIEDVIASSPPACPACGQPMQPQGHKCIRNN